MGGNGPVMPFVCEHCDKRFAMYHELMSHKKLHKTGETEDLITETKTYGCDECGKSYTYLLALQKHALTCRENRHQCPDCEESYPTKRALKHHRELHDEEERVHSEVKKVVKTPGEKKKSSGQEHVCSECGKVCDTKKSLRTHMRRQHTDGKTHTCEECGKNFSQQGNLNTHRKLHTGERPFTCKICGKGYVQKINMVNHAAKCKGLES